MTDYSEAELLAIEKCFATTKVFLCDFHREQAWERWVKDCNHGLSKVEQEELLSLLRACANAPVSQNIHRENEGTTPDEEQESKDGLSGYHLAVADLKSSSVWKDHEDVQMWLSTYWLTIPMVGMHLLKKCNTD